MDPLTQGAVGAVLPQAISNHAYVRRAAFFGFCAGILADLDIIFSSSHDPLFFLEFHRQFTHSLIFIPFGGGLCAIILYSLLGQKWHLNFSQTYFFCTVGYSTHCLLDACTSYGTQLLWPFSNMRVSWDIIAIIDPLITFPLITGVLITTLTKKPIFARITFGWSILYLLIGLYQRDQAITFASDLAFNRGHNALRIEAKPSFANLIVWKTIYETENQFYIDAIRLLGSPKLFKGKSIAKLNVSEQFPWLDPDSQQARDVERFRWFSDNYIAQNPKFKNQIIDVRYSMLPNDINPLWFIVLKPDSDKNMHAEYRVNRSNTQKNAIKLWSMIINK